MKRLFTCILAAVFLMTTTGCATSSGNGKSYYENGQLKEEHVEDSASVAKEDSMVGMILVGAVLLPLIVVACVLGCVAGGSGRSGWQHNTFFAQPRNPRPYPPPPPPPPRLPPPPATPTPRPCDL